jgi:hypothetical protein
MSKENLEILEKKLYLLERRPQHRKHVFEVSPNFGDDENIVAC